MSQVANLKKCVFHHVRPRGHPIIAETVHNHFEWQIPVETRMSNGRRISVG